ncbi:MAG TPA: alpha/beta fold hydrolase [Puia sp.]|nr:alpha/beta fold hydrolase [Puia sp.]
MQLTHLPIFTKGAIRYCLLFGLLSSFQTGFSQTGRLTVEKIMQDPKWIGTSPSDPYWSQDGKYLFFSWNPDKALSDSVYYITKEDRHPQKASYAFQQANVSAGAVSYNKARTTYIYSKDGDIFEVDVKTGKETRITNTVDKESDLTFSFHDHKIVYTRNSNLFAWDIATGQTEQLTNFLRTAEPPKDDKKESLNSQEKWLRDDQLQQFDVLKTRKFKKDRADSIQKARQPHALKNIYIDDKTLNDLTISPDGRFITYRLIRRPTGAHNTIVPSYVTESGFTQDIPGRSKVGAPQGSVSFFVFDREKDTVIAITADEIPGITDLPDYVKDYPAPAGEKARAGKDTASLPKKGAVKPRGVIINGPDWSEQGTHAVVDIRSQDNKDRWLMLLDASTGKLTLLDRQRDEAWIAGPGIGYSFGGGNSGWINENTYWYQSEASGYSHLYKADVNTGEKTALTSGHYEIQRASLSKDKRHFYITTNEVDPGEQQFYQLPLSGGKAERITTLTGANQVVLSPDEKQLAVLYSYTNKPWELYLQDNKPGSHPQQITFQAMSDSFRAYPWRDPALITFTARDGAIVHARLYRAAGSTSSHPAVIFVHGAGYLQNAHKWWSSYFREYMFNNLLADNGYTVLDIDYRGSAGYGRDWRTGIYRHMGGKDLSDQVDGVRYLVEHEGVDPKKVGLYGGSYGGFITLMALFTEPDVFAAGAGLRSVTDWAHYNHGYTSDILNEPYNDSLAYRRSSPIYFAEGLKGHLLMCHGMVDENVHFQDIVRLTQRLIELGKNNWELAVYPLEDHGFVEPSSWTDEYKRIFRLFETYLKP